MDGYENNDNFRPPMDQNPMHMGPPMGPPGHHGGPMHDGNMPMHPPPMPPPNMMQPPPNSMPHGGFDNNQNQDMYNGPPPPPQPPMFGGPPNNPPMNENNMAMPLMSQSIEPTADFASKMRDQEIDDNSNRKGFKLPVALEKMLAYKDERAKQVGVTNESARKALQGDPELEKLANKKTAEITNKTTAEKEEQMKLQAAKLEIAQSLNIDVEKGSLAEAGEKARKALKNKKKKEKKKRRKANKMLKANEQKNDDKEKKISQDALENEKAVEIDYVSEGPDLSDPFMRQFKSVFEAFKIAEEIENADQKDGKSKEIKSIKDLKKETVKNLEEEEDEENDEDKPKISKRQMRRLNRLSVAELKQLVSRPDVVEMHDVTAQDPRLLVHLKATRNSVPVPRHWCFKRKYLQGKRGFEKPPFDLPEFIKSTGIMEMREALQEKEDSKNMKSKMREKVRPKMGKIDIDYQKLHDAFFRYQTKPRMTGHGELYYETKEFETRLKEKKPGHLSDELRTTLGMPLGANAHKVPPPWLIAMQRYGPPPSYPNLKIPGLNCPIPEGCSFGYHVGGWGKPPVDEIGRPLYGDVFGVLGIDADNKINEDEIERQPWGDLESESEEESSEEEEDEEEDEQPKPDESGFVTPAAESGIATPSGISSVPTGLETPDMIELRKRKIEDAMESGETPELFTVLPEKMTAGIGKSMMGSSHVYDMAQARRQGAAAAAGVSDLKGVEVVLNPEELELDNAAMAAKYEAQVREQQASIQKEDFSDMVAEHAAKQKKKRKAQTQDPRSSTKKYKEFKF